MNSTSVWEVKPDTAYGWATGPGQLQRYIDKSGLSAGKAVPGLSSVPYGDTVLNLKYVKGIVYYSQPKKDPNKEPVVAEVPVPEKQTQEKTFWDRAGAFGLALVLTAATVGLCADDATGFGVADDGLVPVAGAAAIESFIVAFG